MSLSAHAQTIATIVGTGGVLVTLGGVATRKVLKPVRRVADAYEAFIGSPADPALDRPATPGVMPRLSSIDRRLDGIDRGQVHIIAEQDAAKTRHAVLAREVGGIRDRLGRNPT